MKKLMLALKKNGSSNEKGASQPIHEADDNNCQDEDIFISSNEEIIKRSKSWH